MSNEPGIALNIEKKLMPVECFVGEIIRYAPHPIAHRVKFTAPKQFEEIYQLLETEQVLIDMSAMSETLHVDYSNIILFGNRDRVLCGFLKIVPSLPETQT
ncbi:MAG TPA: hypothetical protein VKZ53_06765 [Candidatus Angelobacter sp.]|nr:hypothetical protein [Candidatus Angelobacter sp.]